MKHSFFMYALVAGLLITVLAGMSSAQTPVVSWDSDARTVLENAGSVTFSAELDAAAAVTVYVPFTISGTATGGGKDYVAGGDSITIPAGDTSASMTFNITNDTVYETDETIIITMQAPTNAEMGSPSVHTITVEDDDPEPGARVFWEGPFQYVDEDAGVVKITAVLDAAVMVPVNVPFTVSGTASGEGVDHDLADGVITIPAEELNASRIFSVNDDDIGEGTETVVVSMGDPENAMPGSVTEHTVYIRDNDKKPGVSWAASAQVAAEDAGAVTLTLTLTEPSSQDVLAPFSVSGTATGGKDHDLAAGEATIPAGDTTAEISFNIIDDDVAEGDETVIVTIKLPVNAVVGDIPVHRVTIRDNDEGPVPTVFWTVAAQTVSESAGSVSISVSLSGAGEADVKVPFTVGGTAGPDKHDLADGEIVVPVGETSASLSFNLIDNAVPENPKTIVVSLEAPEGAELGTVTEHTITIKDDDDIPSVQWLHESQSVSESAPTVAVVAVLSFASGQDVTIPYVVTGTADIDGADHNLVSGEFTIVAGQTTGALIFSPVDDEIPESDETVVVTIGTPANAKAGSKTVHTVTIVDDDVSPEAGWTVPGKSVKEDAGAVELTVMLSKTLEVDALVNYSVSGTAEGEGVDHDLVPGVITIPAGQLTASIIVNITDDEIAEPDETVIVTLNSPVNAVIGENYALVLTIQDNDPDNLPPEITINGPRAVTVELGTDYHDAGATATDNVDGDMTGRIVVGSSVNTKAEGIYRVTYNVRDEAGNPAVQVDRLVLVYYVPAEHPRGFVMDRNGDPLADVEITSNELDDRVYTDELGAFEYPALYKTGKVYYLTLSMPGYAPASVKYTGEAPLGRITLISYDDTDCFFAGGVCRSYDGHEIEGAVIAPDIEADAPFALSGPDGRYVLATLPENTPKRLKAHKVGYKSGVHTITQPVDDNDVTLVRETGLLIGRPSNRRMHDEALGLDTVEFKIAAIPEFTGVPGEISVSPYTETVYSSNGYSLYHYPYESFSVEIRADSTEDRNTQIGYYASRYITFTAVPEDSPVEDTSGAFEPAAGRPVIMRSEDRASHAVVIIPADALKGEYIPDQVFISMIEYRNVKSESVDGKIVEIEILDEHGRLIGMDPENPEDPIKEIVVFLDYQAPVTKAGLRNGSDKILFGESPKALMNYGGVVTPVGRIMRVDETAVGFYSDYAGSFALKEQELKSTETEDYCFIGAVFERRRHINRNGIEK